MSCRLLCTIRLSRSFPSLASEDVLNQIYFVDPNNNLDLCVKILLDQWDYARLWKDVQSRLGEHGQLL